MLKHSISSFIYRTFVKPIFFRMNPENVHDRTIEMGAMLGRFRLTRWVTRKLFAYQDPILRQSVLGMDFPNPVGLSAGFDKNGRLADILPHVGFGHFELGSVTYDPYEGNPPPRLYRLKKSKALVVYYGLMNLGVRNFIKSISTRQPSDAVLGISVAKTNCDATATEVGGIEDYFNCIKYLQEHEIPGYLTINISCPNTFGGEPFTTPEKLDKLLTAIDQLNIKQPTLLKMPINLSNEEFGALLDVAVSHSIQGVVIGNLTKTRDPDLILDEIPEHVRGGISGKPTWDLCNRLISYTYKNYGDRLIIIGVGGVFSAEDAYEKILRGATLIQLITGMIYQGPQLIGQINHGLAKLCRADGYAKITEAVGKGEFGE